MNFICCDGCARHVREDEPSCPFCGEAVVAASPVVRKMSGRHKRVARLAIGAGLLVSLTACPAYGAPDEPDGSLRTFDSGVDSGMMDAGGEDAGGQDAGGEDAGEDAGGASDAGEDSGAADSGASADGG